MYLFKCRFERVTHNKHSVPKANQKIAWNTISEISFFVKTMYIMFETLIT